MVHYAVLRCAVHNVHTNSPGESLLNLWQSNRLDFGQFCLVIITSTGHSTWERCEKKMKRKGS